MTTVTSLKGDPASTTPYLDFLLGEEDVLPSLSAFPHVATTGDTLTFSDDEGGYITFSGRKFDVTVETTKDVLGNDVTTVHILGGTATKVTYGSTEDGGVLTGLKANLFDLVYAANSNDAASLVKLMYAGDDTFKLQSGNDTAYGFGGNDTIYVGSGDNSAYGGDGNDFIGLIAGLNGQKSISLSGMNRLFGENGNDTIVGGAAVDVMDGGSGDDTVNGGGGNDVLNGGTGKDAIFGGNGSDIISGDAANDRMDGGAGNDVLTGGAGADVFVFGVKAGHDTITDFTMGMSAHDQIEITARTNAHDIGSIEKLMTESADGVVIDFGKDELYIAHATIAELTSAGAILFV
jgi:Ca2+-binding RTX toxin-like protein